MNRRQLILSALAGLLVPTWADVETDRELLLRLCGVNFQTDASLRHYMYLYRQGEIGEELLINRFFRQGSPAGPALAPWIRPLQGRPQSSWGIAP